jgi:hypothetical protein
MESANRREILSQRLASALVEHLNELFNYLVCYLLDL